MAAALRDRVTIGTLEFLMKFRENALPQKDLEEWAMRSLDEQKEVEDDDEFISTKYKTASSAAQSIFNKLNAMKGAVEGPAANRRGERTSR